MRKFFTIVAVLVFACLSPANSFIVRRSIGHVHSTALFAERRQPRRKLKKRRSRMKRDKRLYKVDDLPSNDASTPLDEMETRPLVADRRREVGEDYWIDEEDLRKANAREKAIKNRKALEGEIPKEKLWGEVMAPYKQNWIGLFSIVIVTLAVLINKFPELLSTPSIEIPDL